MHKARIKFTYQRISVLDAKKMIMWNNSKAYVYGDLHAIHTNWNERTAYFVKRSILTPLNKDVDAKYIGQTYFRNEDGSSVDMTTYLSADEVIAG
jgi:hypothetical protein